MRAQEEGYDAFAVGHFQDSGLMESKSVVDIPVLGLGETTMLHACTLARKTGLVTIHPVFIPWHEEQIAAYGLGSRMTGVRAMTTSPLDYVAAISDRSVYESIRDQFVAQAQPFVDEGVDALIPAGGLPMLLLASEHGFNVGGAPVLNGLKYSGETDRNGSETESDRRHGGQPAVQLRPAERRGYEGLSRPMRLGQ